MQARNGFAVLLALFAMTLLGALCTAMVYAAREETRASEGHLSSTRALSSVESALSTTVASFDWSSAMSLRPGQHLTIHSTGPTRVSITIARLDTTCFFVQAVTPDPLAVSVNERFTRRIALTIEVGADSAGTLRPLRVPNRGWTELF